ncbi:MAG: SAM-dependent chlorinase/fluorinase [Acidobacteria bacterium]|nr:SAM-dependent chlorinase/fluorinase [Acidobacteriota bacterium]
MIALLTDFGIEDTYVAELKLVLLSHGIEHTLDISHHVEAGNPRHGQFLLQSVYQRFPAGTVFLGVVDPGVGTKRVPVAIRFGRYWFVGPDNGLFSFASAGDVFHIDTKDPLFSPRISETFHGRDIFAPAAAGIHNHTDRFLKKMAGLSVVTPIRFVEEITRLFPGEVLHVDGFGNLVTSVRNALLGRVALVLAGKTVVHSHSTFSEGGDGMFMVPGSKGFIEIVARKRRASDMLKVEIGTQIEVRIK